MPKKPTKRKVKWVRDGTIVCGRYTQIDLRPSGQFKIWLTVKATDGTCEALSLKLLNFLNR